MGTESEESGKIADCYNTASVPSGSEEDRREWKVKGERQGQVLVLSVRSKGSKDYLGLSMWPKSNYNCPNKSKAERDLVYTE